MPQTIQIFRAGTHTSAEGARVSFSESDLDAMVSAYDPAVHEAPLVVGHPKHDGPAHGWVRGLSRKGASLEASADVHASFADQVREGKYKKLSASFYTPQSPDNPTPGSYYLRHVGFLGAMPPAVKGLRAVGFADAGAGFVTIDFAEPGQADGSLPANADAGAAADGAADAAAKTKFDVGATVKARGKAGIIAEVREPGFYAVLFEGDTEPTRWVAEDELEATAAASVDPGTASHAERNRGRVALSRADLDLVRRTKDLEAREARLRTEERRVRRADHLGFCEQLVRSGRVLTTSRAETVSFMEALDAADPKTTTASFGEGETRSLSDIFKQDYLSRLPKQVEFSELSAPESLPSDASSEQIAAAAVVYQSQQETAGNTVSTSEAVAHVQRR